MILHFYVLIMSSSSEKLTVTVKDDGFRIVTDSNKDSAKPRRMTAEEIIEAERSFYENSSEPIVIKSASPAEVMDFSVPNEHIVVDTMSDSSIKDNSETTNTSIPNEPIVVDTISEFPVKDNVEVMDTSIPKEPINESTSASTYNTSHVNENESDCDGPYYPNTYNTSQPSEYESDESGV